MSIQIVSTTQVQRNFKQVLQKLTSPVLVVRDSSPAAVMLSYPEYQRLVNLEKQAVKQQMADILSSLAEKNTAIPDSQVNADIDQAQCRARRSR